MYEMKTRVRYSETDAQSRLKLTALVDYLQDCAIFHAEDAGVGCDYMQENGWAWMLISWQIRIRELPKIGERLTVVTDPYEFKRFLGSRYFSVCREGEADPMVEANSSWAFIDLKKQHPTRFPDDMPEKYGARERDERFAGADRKMNIPEPKRCPNADWENEKSFVVPESAIDINDHVNNGQYIHMAYQYLPKDFKIGEIRVEYKAQARKGDVICPKILKDWKLSEEKSGYVTDLCSEDGDVYCAVMFVKSN